jgi:hypothetical protein
MLTFEHFSRISRQVRESLLPKEYLDNEGVCTPLKSGMTVAEKMALWDMAKDSETLPEARLPDEGDEFQPPPRYQEVRSFLLKSHAYNWLLKSARTSTTLTRTTGNTMRYVFQSVETALSPALTTRKMRSSHLSSQARFVMDWDVVTFLRRQNYCLSLDIALERAITITGSGTIAQALSCVEYMQQTWPFSGRAVLQILQKALRSLDFACTGKTHPYVEGQPSQRLRRGYTAEHLT